MDEEDLNKLDVTGPPVVPEGQSTGAGGAEGVQPDEVNPVGTNEDKEKTIELLKKKNPSADFSSDAELWRSIFKLLSQLITFEDRLYEVIEEFPEFGEALDALLSGMEPGEAIARYFDVDGLTPPEGAPDFEKIQAGKSDRRKKLEGIAARKKQLVDNEQISVENVKKMSENRGWDKQKTIAFLDKIAELQSDLFDGKLSETHLDVLEKGFAFDQVVAEKDAEIEAAAEDGRIAGRNEQIMKKRAGKETGDGLPRLSNTGSSDSKKSSNVSLVNSDLPSQKLKFK